MLGIGGCEEVKISIIRAQAQKGWTLNERLCRGTECMWLSDGRVDVRFTRKVWCCCWAPVITVLVTDWIIGHCLADRPLATTLVQTFSSVVQHQASCWTQTERDVWLQLKWTTHSSCDYGLDDWYNSQLLTRHSRHADHVQQQLCIYG